MEGLLKNRWRITSPWPGLKEARKKVGDIVLQSKDTVPQNWHLQTGYITKAFADEFPNLFHPLNWYDDRDQDEMPGYIRFGRQVSLVKEWQGSREGGWLPIGNDSTGELPEMWRIYCGFIVPATEVEYHAQDMVLCPACDGNGYIVEEDDPGNKNLCSYCGKAGVVPKEHGKQ